MCIAYTFETMLQIYYEHIQHLLAIKTIQKYKKNRVRFRRVTVKYRLLRIYGRATLRSDRFIEACIIDGFRQHCFRTVNHGVAMIFCAGVRS